MPPGQTEVPSSASTSHDEYSGLTPITLLYYSTPTLTSTREYSTRILGLSELAVEAGGSPNQLAGNDGQLLCRPHCVCPEPAHRLIRTQDWGWGSACNVSAVRLSHGRSKHCTQRATAARLGQSSENPRRREDRVSGTISEVTSWRHYEARCG